MTFSVRFMAKAWRWSDKRVQRFLSALVFDQSVTTQTTTGQTLITLCKWAAYQRPNSSATTQTEMHTTAQSTTKRNELYELNELNDDVEKQVRDHGKSLSDKGEEVSADKRDAIALGLTFLNAAGFKDHAEAPMNWYGVTERAAKWIKAGYSVAMIVAETKQIAGQGNDNKPLVYFDKVFATAQARTNQPLPVVAMPLAGKARSFHPHRGNRVSDAFDILIAKAIAQEQGNLHSTSAAFSGLGDRVENRSDVIEGAVGPAPGLWPPR
ncbi:hypothetical protein [Bradyrhizobium sp.]|uniref:hypothetical protein n=1 Tax=Bradyrhizobium sp. TaxID=376 RepID=UPI00273291A9|nr:hypothetical protein [Bradyrhizobium sp.]MDP3691842.1 hypothetical protein [Bradyrhizobium sp.]